MSTLTTPKPTVAVTIRNIPPKTHQALKRRAAANGRSTEAEIRAILEASVTPQEQLKVGTEIRKLVERFGGYDLDIQRDPTPAGLVSFE
jgi:plasmid stability protein